MSAHHPAAVWWTVSAAGTGVETFTAGGRVDMAVLAPLGGMAPERELDEYDPVCDSRLVPAMRRRACGECSHRSEAV